jgi:hypothetical protein
MKPLLTISFLMIILLACQQTKSDQKIESLRTETSAQPPVQVSTSAPLAKDVITYSVESKMQVKEVKGGPIIKIKFPEIKAEPASHSVLDINKKIEQKRDELMQHYLEFIDEDIEADTVMIIDIEANIWANKLLSVSYHLNEWITDYQGRGYVDVSYAHFSLSTGNELRTSDIFKPSITDRWQNWLRMNVSSELYVNDASWEDHTFFNMSFDNDSEEFQGTWQEFFDQILQHGYYVIEEDGDLDYLIYYKHNLNSRGTVPYPEIKDCFKINPVY